MRTISTILMIIFAIFIVFFAPAILGVAMMCAITFISTCELIKTLKNEEMNKNIYIYALFASVLPINIFYNNPMHYSVYILASLYVLSMRFFKKYSLKEVLIVFSAMIILPQAFNSLTRLYLLENGQYYLMLPVLCASVTDIFAFLCGKTFGKHKLAPKVSPNKTIEGAIGGIFACIVSVCLYSVFTYDILGISLLNAILIGLFGSIFGIIGDLFFSKIKRDAGIKDYSNIIPGHGGILDRFDSMIFTSFITYFILTIM